MRRYYIALLALAVLLTVGGIGVEGIEHFDEALLFAVAVAVAAIPPDPAASSGPGADSWMRDSTFEPR